MGVKERGTVRESERGFLEGMRVRNGRRRTECRGGGGVMGDPGEIGFGIWIGDRWWEVG